MPDNSDCKIATADALTLLLHNQHADVDYAHRIGIADVVVEALGK